MRESSGDTGLGGGARSGPGGGFGAGSLLEHVRGGDGVSTAPAGIGTEAEEAAEAGGEWESGVAADHGEG